MRACWVPERRNQREHPQYTKPELLATGPIQVWSWDVTKLLGPKKWTYFYLYVLLDIYSRYVVGWMVADRENSALAGRLIEQTCHKQGIQPQMLTLHSDSNNPQCQVLPGEVDSHSDRPIVGIWCREGFRVS